VDLIVDSFLLFGRASLGATIGVIIGTITQGHRHVRWAIGWMLIGYVAGTATMWPCAPAIIASVLLLIPAPLWTFLGLLVAAGTLGDHSDRYIRTWGWVGFLAGFHATAIGAMAAVNAFND